MTQLESYRALVLNADYRPLATYPLSSLSWMDAIRRTLAGKAVVVAEYDRVVRTARLQMAVPAVVALRHYVDLSRPAPLNRINLFVRDRMCCVFCGERFSASELTFDHLVPRARGGRSTWDNLVAACLPCNQRKGDRLPGQVGMRVLTKPYRPSLAELNAIGAGIGDAARVPADWQDWLYWTVRLEP